ncbi:hypothetical protein Dimus_033837, partial [Dionaea muscipula]
HETLRWQPKSAAYSATTSPPWNSPQTPSPLPSIFDSSPSSSTTFLLSPLRDSPFLVSEVLGHQEHDFVFVAGKTTIAMGDTADLSGDGGVIKTIVKQAKPNAISPSDDLPLVDVQYEGILAETGKVFDTTREDNTTFSFEIGKGTVIKAWDIALRTMKVESITLISSELFPLNCLPSVILFLFVILGRGDC